LCYSGNLDLGVRCFVETMRVLSHWIATNANLLAILVTVGVAFLLVLCLQCTKCGCREKDELFKRHET
jgi:hypothetical protein